MLTIPLTVDPAEGVRMVTAGCWVSTGGALVVVRLVSSMVSVARELIRCMNVTLTTPAGGINTPEACNQSVVGINSLEIPKYCWVPFDIVYSPMMSEISSALYQSL